jgi:hydrogenase maturation factor HypF (carbamoyltransferase family)
LNNLEVLLKQDNFEVYTNSQVPSNDGGIALGQLAIGAKWRENNEQRTMNN